VNIRNHYRECGPWTISPVKDSAENTRFFISIQKDVTQLHAEQATGNLFAKAIDAAYDGIFITSADGVIEFSNQGFEIITGYTPSEVIGRTPSFLKSGHHDDAFYKRLWQHLNQGLAFRAMIVNRHKAGHEIHCQQTITPVKSQDGTTSHFISIIKDMTDRVFEELKLREQASRDKMTGLLNRRGDEIIQVVANILLGETRKTDKCIRWGGEEFIVLLPFCDLGKGRKIAETIRAGGSTALSVQGKRQKPGQSGFTVTIRPDGRRRAEHRGLAGQSTRRGGPLH